MKSERKLEREINNYFCRMRYIYTHTQICRLKFSRKIQLGLVFFKNDYDRMEK